MTIRRAIRDSKRMQRLRVEGRSEARRAHEHIDDKRRTKRAFPDCKVPSCTRQCIKGDLFCDLCWLRIPSSLRRKLQLRRGTDPWAKAYRITVAVLERDVQRRIARAEAR